MKREPINRALLLDIGNTHTHVGFGDDRRVTGVRDFKTADWFAPGGRSPLHQWIARQQFAVASVCSVVPRATRRAVPLLRRLSGSPVLELTAATVRGVGVRYPKPSSIGPDRLANAVAVRARFGVPAVVVDFGTAVTFDVVDAKGDYIGGVIAPGLAAMTDYLHEKTALLPRIEVREVRRAVGRSTVEAMRIGAVRGYRGLIRGLLADIRSELGTKRLRVVATGGCARLVASRMPEIDAVVPELTLEGLRLEWLARRKG